MVLGRVTILDYNRKTTCMLKISRILSFSLFLSLGIYGAFQIPGLQFSFDFEQFFPEGDEDLAFFQDFIRSFETDDNFLMIAVKRDSGVFEQGFLEKFHEFSLEARDLPHVVSAQSLTKLTYPVRTPFGVIGTPMIHIDQPEKYDSDKKRILADDRFVNTLIDEKAKSMVVFLKLVNSINLDQATELMDALEPQLNAYNFEAYHMLGRPYFQTELVDMQKREIIFSAIVSGILVTLVMLLIFRRVWGIGIAIASIGMGILLFLGFMGFTGREFSAMAALYPVLMIIVGTSDVIHIMSKYIDELRKGKDRVSAIRVTIREIGLATLLTSLTTAVGFASLFTSRIAPIRDFGINAAVGVLLAYVTVVGFTTALLTFFRKEQIIKTGAAHDFWEKLMARTYRFTREHGKNIGRVSLVFLLICLWGISLISTDYNIAGNLPRGKKITEDFLFFEEEMAGFRPMELAVTAKNDNLATDYAVVKEIDKVEQHLRGIPAVQVLGSVSTVYRSLHEIFGNDGNDFPATEEKFRQYERMAGRIPQAATNVLVSRDSSKARISTRLKDIGADSIKWLGQEIDTWIAANTDTVLVEFRRTGTGTIIDKNSVYVRQDLINGLGLAVAIVSILMALLFRNMKMILISLVPNLIPLLMAGAMLGFLGIELEAGIAIVFAVIFGIAVDDTIHFLSKFKLVRSRGVGIEEALKVTFQETGKAICLTTIILFFGFLIMLFSIHPPSVIVGTLISVTLFSAVISDLLLIPVLISYLMKD